MFMSIHTKKKKPQCKSQITILHILYFHNFQSYLYYFLPSTFFGFNLLSFLSLSKLDISSIGFKTCLFLFVYKPINFPSDKLSLHNTNFDMSYFIIIQFNNFFFGLSRSILIVQKYPPLGDFLLLYYLFMSNLIPLSSVSILLTV